VGRQDRQRGEGARETWSSCFCMLAPGMKVLDLITATASLFDTTTLSSGGCGVGVRTEEGIWVLLPCGVPCVCNLVSMQLPCGCPVRHGSPPLPAAAAPDPVPGWKVPGSFVEVHGRFQEAYWRFQEGSRKVPGRFQEGSRNLLKPSRNLQEASWNLPGTSRTRAAVLPSLLCLTHGNDKL
jgi:hypothetical protein